MGYCPNAAASNLLVASARLPGATLALSPRIDRLPMSLLLAAIGATVAALLEVSLVPYLRIGDAHPHPVLVLGVIWTVALGLEGGLTWAFVGGIALDIMAQRPLGSSAFALLVSVGGASALARVLSRVRPIVPVLAVAMFSLVNSLLQLAIFGALRSPIPIADPVGSLLPGVAYDTVLAIVVGPLVVAIRDRYRDQDRVDW